MLLAAGVNTHVPMKKGGTALQLAMDHDYKEIVALLSNVPQDT
jgi:hypothetical protein